MPCHVIEQSIADGQEVYVTGFLRQFFADRGGLERFNPGFVTLNAPDFGTSAPIAATPQTIALNSVKADETPVRVCIERSSIVVLERPGTL